MPCTNLVTVDGVVVMTAEDNSYKGRDAARPARGGALAHAELEEASKIGRASCRERV